MAVVLDDLPALMWRAEWGRSLPNVPPGAAVTRRKKSGTEPVE
jgi:hypothetical protein